MSFQLCNETSLTAAERRPYRGGVMQKQLQPPAAPTVICGDPAIEGETGTETITRTELARPWNVIVHDDPVTLMSYVTNAFMEVFGYARAKAHRLMMEVHESGRSVVWTGERERAEIYVQKLQARHLLTKLERVDG